MSPVLSKKTLREIRTYLDPKGRLVEAIDAALKPKRSVTAAKVRRVAKLSSRKDAVLELRAAVFLRAGAKCEVCGADATDLEHAFGRVRVKPSPRNCLALCRPCHVARTNLRPSACHWWSLYARIFAARGDERAAEMAEALALKHAGAA